MENIKFVIHNQEVTNKALYQIFVPVADNDGNDFPIEHHKAWDNRVKSISGGLTINKRSRGIWQSQMTGKIFEEKMIPVSIFCSSDEIKRIILMTLNHYDQQAIMCYKISDTVMIAEREKNGN